MCRGLIPTSNGHTTCFRRCTKYYLRSCFSLLRLRLPLLLTLVLLSVDACSHCWRVSFCDQVIEAAIEADIDDVEVVEGDEEGTSWILTTPKDLMTLAGTQQLAASTLCVLLSILS